MGYIVAKFGGWANASAENVKLAADLFEKNRDRKIKVNSAIGKVEGLPKVTDLLTEGAEAVLKTGVFPKDILEKIKLNHYTVFKPLKVPEDVIDNVLILLEKRLPMKDSLSPDHFRALIIGSGEELFSRLDAYYLKEIRKLNARYVDPRDIGHYLGGHPLDGHILPESYENLSRLQDMDGIIVYPGFFAISNRGEPMIYSRGGTDKTAADIATAVNATLYENWKDVDGIYCADPRIVKDPELMEKVTYKEIRELSYISFNVLHQEAMLPVMNAEIPVNIKNLLKPDSKGTLIVHDREHIENRPVIGIAGLKGICVINIEKRMMNEEIGFAEKVMALFRENRISIEQIATSIDTIAVLAKEIDFKEKSIHFGISESVRKEIDFDEFTEYLKTQLKADKVKISRNRSLMCVVGQGMRKSIGTLGRIATSLSNAGINIEIVDQGPSERNVIVCFKDEEDYSKSKKAVEVLYKEFFQNN